MAFAAADNSTGNSDIVKIDWAYVATQVDEGSQVGIIRGIVDVGYHEQPLQVKHDKGQTTVVDTEEEAEDLIKKAIDATSETDMANANLDDFSETEDGKFVVPFELVKPRNQNEVAVIVELPDTLVEYVEGSGEKVPYRTLLNSVFKGDMRGLPLKASQPTPNDPKLWTLHDLSKLHKLATASNTKEIVDGKDSKLNMRVDLMVGKALFVNIVNKNGFIKTTNDFMPLPKGYPVTPLPSTPVAISFEDATLAQLNDLKPMYPIIKRCKESLTYEGSAMQSAIVAYESQDKEEVEAKVEVKEEAKPAPQAQPEAEADNPFA